MYRYRSAALALAACAAGLSLAACSAGITTAPPAPGPTSSRPATSATASSNLDSSGGTVSVGGSIGNFPIPSGAKVVEKINIDKQIEIVIGSVSPQKASSFYASALPQAGYKVTLNGLSSSGNSTALGIQFTGHGYKGIISAASNVPGASLPSTGKDFLAILLTKQ
jgi:hypothetical protein